MMKSKKTAKSKAGKNPPAKKAKKSSADAYIRGPRALKGSRSLLKELIAKEKEILQVEDALVESMHRFRDLFEQSPVGVGIYNAKGELLVVNKAYLEIFGFDSFGDIKQQNLFSDFELTEKEKGKIRSGQVVQQEVRYAHETHRFIPGSESCAHILLSISPFFRENDLIGYKLQIQDITERKKIAEAQRLAQLGRLVSDVAHEVNNPLMIISGRTELALMEKIKDKKTREMLDVILKQCYLAKDIIQRVLQYARRGKAEKTPVDIRKTIGLIVELLQHRFYMARIALKTDIKPDMPMVMGDEKQLQEVFMNIIRNAVDAMPEGGVITIKTSRRKDLLKVDITDTGKGMSRRILDRIFEPFFTTRRDGTGLGLAVCQTIMQEHGGELRYKSKAGQGTTASILLPIKHAV